MNTYSDGHSGKNFGSNSRSFNETITLLTNLVTIAGFLGSVLIFIISYRKEIKQVCSTIIQVAIKIGDKKSDTSPSQNLLVYPEGNIEQLQEYYRKAYYYTYTVRKHDTVAKIAIDHSMTVQELLLLNPELAETFNSIHFGVTRIKVRPWRIHYVSRLERLADIAKKYNISFKVIKLANNRGSNMAIKGEYIIIPKP